MPRRTALLALGTALTVLVPLGGSAASAAPDPITSQAAPTLVSPAADPSGANPLKDVVLSWSSVTYATKYQVQVSPNGDWTNNVVGLPNNGKTVNTVFEMPISLPYAFYYWRVRALHGSAHTDWSSQRTFLHEWYDPFQVLQAPTASDPSIAWQPVPGASVYRVRYSTKADFSGDDTHACFTSNTSFTPYATNQANSETTPGDCFTMSDLTQGATYFWQVVAYDDSTADGITADTAPDGSWDCGVAQPACDTYFPNEQQSLIAKTFTFSAPVAGDAPDLDVPVTGRTTSWHANSLTAHDCTSGTCSMTPTFSWDPVAGANYYEVHVWHDPAAKNTYRVYDTSVPSVTPRDQFFDAQAGTAYYWTVTPGICRNDPSSNFCATVKGSGPQSPTCASPGTVATAPSIDGNGLSPTSMSAGATTTVTLTGSNFADNACVQTTGGGIISGIVVDSATQVHFTYTAPTSSDDPVTFQVVNPDGGVSNDSPGLTITGSFDRVVLGTPMFPAATFDKASDPLTLSGPTNGGLVNGGSVTFNWNDFLPTGGNNGYDVRNYRLQVASDDSFDDVLWDVQTVDLTQYTNPTDLLPDGQWFWRVAGIDESGNLLTWSTTRTITEDGTAPVFRLTDADGVASDGTLHVKVDDPTTTGTVSQSTLNVFPVVGDQSALAGSWTQGASSWVFHPAKPLVPGQSYGLRVLGGLHDPAGNLAVASPHVVRATLLADDKSPVWNYTGSWSTHTSSNAIRGSFHSGGSGHAAAVKVVGTLAKVYGCKGPSFGSVSISLDGTTKTTVSEHRSFTQCGLLLWKGTISAGAVHTVTVAPASGTVALDAVRVG